MNSFHLRPRLTSDGEGLLRHNNKFVTIWIGNQEKRRYIWKYFIFFTWIFALHLDGIFVFGCIRTEILTFVNVWPTKGHRINKDKWLTEVVLPFFLFAFSPFLRFHEAAWVIHILKLYLLFNEILKIGIWQRRLLSRYQLYEGEMTNVASRYKGLVIRQNNLNKNSWLSVKTPALEERVALSVMLGVISDLPNQQTQCLFGFDLQYIC